MGTTLGLRRHAASCKGRTLGLRRCAAEHTGRFFKMLPCMSVTSGLGASDHWRGIVNDCEMGWGVFYASGRGTLECGGCCAPWTKHGNHGQMPVGSKICIWSAMISPQGLLQDSDYWSRVSHLNSDMDLEV